MYIEFDPDGVPLGAWRYDGDADEWIFEEYPAPQAALPRSLPKTGGAGGAAQLLMLMALLVYWLKRCEEGRQEYSVTCNQYYYFPGICYCSPD